MPYPSKRKLQSRAAVDARRKKIQLHAAEPRDAEPPSFADPPVSELPDSQESDSNEQLSSGSESRNGLEGGMLGAWPESSEAEDEQQDREAEECEAMEEQQKVVRVMGQPAAGWTKAECLLGSGGKTHVPLSENYCSRRIGVCQSALDTAIYQSV